MVEQTKRAFRYDHVFGPEQSDAHIESSVKDLVTNLIQGYNVTIFAYGQTGSGKTYTLGSTDTSGGNVGIIPLVLNGILGDMNEVKDRHFRITVSFMELYMKKIHDLLSENVSSVRMINDGTRIHIRKLIEKRVTSAADATEWLRKGISRRATGATAMNAQSSRSHAIFTVTVQKLPRGNEKPSQPGLQRRSPYFNKQPA